ncbi:MAG: hypothetical protein ABSD74_03930 [Rhizomicrobium sp.]|jgi:hypothetical protein
MFASLRSAAALATAATMTAAVLALASPAQAAGPDEGAYHIYQTPEMMQRSGRIPHMPPAGEVLYFGGTVFTSMKVVSVIWGSKVNPTWVAGLPGFLTALPNSTFVDQLSIYDTAGAQSQNKHNSNQTISRGTFVSQVQITPHDTNTNLSDKDVQKELKYQIGQGVLPANDSNTLYMVYFPSDITIVLDKLVSCEDFGAYHFATSKKPKSSNIFYGVEPDCGYSFNDETIVSSHEFAEATTDNIPTPGSNPKYPQAWNTSDGYEIADLCEGTEGTLTAGETTYYVQEVWLNNTGACGTGNFTSP